MNALGWLTFGVTLGAVIAFMVYDFNGEERS